MEEWREKYTRPSITELIFPLLEDIDESEGKYRVHTEDITQILIQADHIIMPDLSEVEKDTEKWELILNAHQNYNKDQIPIMPASLFPQKSDSFSRKEDPLMPVRWDEKDNLNVQQKRKLRMHQVTLDDLFVGYDVQGEFHTDRYFRATTLTDAIRAMDIYQENIVTKDNLTFITYQSDDVQENGGNASVRNIPSIESGNMHEVSLERIPIYHRRWGRHPKLLKDLRRNSFNLESHHACRRITRKSGFGRRTKTGVRYGSEMEFDYHTVLAFNVVHDYIESLGAKVADYFYKPTQEISDYFFWLHRNGFVQYEEGNNIRRIPLTLNKIEVILWKKIAYNNLRNMPIESD